MLYAAPMPHDHHDDYVVHTTTAAHILCSSSCLGSMAHELQYTLVRTSSEPVVRRVVYAVLAHRQFATAPQV
jgi:hypothetical protein